MRITKYLDAISKALFHKPRIVLICPKCDTDLINDYGRARYLCPKCKLVILKGLRE